RRPDHPASASRPAARTWPRAARSRPGTPGRWGRRGPRRRGPSRGEAAAPDDYRLLSGASETPIGLDLFDALRAQLLARAIRFLEPVETLRSQDLRRLHELDIAVVDDLDQVAPGVVEVEPPRPVDADAELVEARADGVLAVDDESEVTRLVLHLRPALGERDELVAHVDEGHA